MEGKNTDADIGGVLEPDTGHAARLGEAMKRNASFASQEVQSELLALARAVDQINALL